MKLVKDLTDDGIIFYWIDEAGDPISTDLRTLDDAREWRVLYLHNAYQGAERRTSIIDRRYNSEKRQYMEQNHQFARGKSQGRREADILVTVDTDLAAQKIKEYY